MIESGQIIASDLVHAEGAASWKQIQDDSILGPLFQQPSNTKTQRKQTKRGKSALLIPLLLMVLATILIWLVWPYYVVFSLFAAVREGDIAILEKHVAWDSVRRGLRDDLNAMMLRDVRARNKDGESGLAAGLSAILGPAVINQLVDGYVTPQAIAEVRRKSSIEKTQDATGGEVDRAINFRQLNFQNVRYAFFSGSPIAFKVEISPDKESPFKEPTTLLFDWSGQWRLSRLVLPFDSLESIRNATNARSVLDREKPQKTPPTAKPKLPDPLQVSLIKKGFKDADYRASVYDSNITIELLITNLTGKNIRAFDGTIIFTDLLDNRILSSKLAINDPIDTQKTLTWIGAIKYNQFMDEHQRLRNESQSNLKLVFSPRKLLFSDGSTVDYESQ